ncbi:complement C1q-like protein 2 [Mercenaria mercenaria]|uniref:complement C1q-like protein 2 n=1 Tax=Mercenaria mercenaria TaxID=6596 RepID=UPI00234EBBD9|nr:complement C1q-like protein 2 [Mercenaria mercenaria]
MFASEALLDSATDTSSEHMSLLQLVSQEQSMRLELESQVHKLQSQIQTLQSQLNNITVAAAKNQQQVAFSGRLQNNLPLSGSTAIVKFENVITNIGNAYSQTTGIFHCPISGLYLFTGNILSDAVGFISMGIYQNGRLIARPYTGAGVHEHESGSDTVVVHANVGDEIYAKDLGGSSVYLDQYSLFTGVLLKADE